MELQSDGTTRIMESKNVSVTEEQGIQCVKWKSGITIHFASNPHRMCINSSFGDGKVTFVFPFNTAEDLRCFVDYCQEELEFIEKDE